MEQVTRPLDLGPQLLSSENLSVMAEVERAIQISETRYRRLFETTQDGILLLNAETEQINDVNPFLLNMLGYKHEEFKGKVIWEIAAFEALSKSQTDFRKLHEIHFIRYDDLPLIAKDGTKFSVELICKFYDYDGINVIQCYIRDNTKRHLAEIALIATTRAHKFLSECNVALLKAKTEPILLAEYCRIAVETGGYQMAWIGVADETDNENIKSLSYFDLSSVDLEAVK